MMSLEAWLVKQPLRYINFGTSDSLSLSWTVNRNESMKLSQAVKSPLKQGRLICGYLDEMFVDSICIVATELIG